MGRFAVLLLGLVILAGCGGGGGGTSTAIPTGNVTRQLQPGDSLTYSLSGSISVEGDTVPVSGTMTTTTYNGAFVPVYGSRALKLVMEMSLQGNGSQYSIIGTNYAEQATNGTIYTIARDNGNGMETLLYCDNSPIVYPGVCTVGGQYSCICQWSDGTTESTSGTIMALEAVNGRMAYKIHESTTTNGDPSSSNEWFVPDIGYPVRSQLVIQQDGVRLNLTANLASKNF